MLLNYYGDCSAIYPSILIWTFRLWIISNILDSSFKAFVIWCSISYTRYTLLILYIFYQIHIFVKSRLNSSQPSSHASNCILEAKSSRRTPVKPGCHWPTRLWSLSSSHYSGNPMTKLTSHHKERRPIASNRLLNLTTNRSAQRW